MGKLERRIGLNTPGNPERKAEVQNWEAIARLENVQTLSIPSDWSWAIFVKNSQKNYLFIDGKVIPLKDLQLNTYTPHTFQIFILFSLYNLCVERFKRYKYLWNGRPSYYYQGQLFTRHLIFYSLHIWLIWALGLGPYCSRPITVEPVIDWKELFRRVQIIIFHFAATFLTFVFIDITLF